eukprot:366036-Chlamydomonas_euryale.AAC.14
MPLPAELCHSSYGLHSCPLSRHGHGCLLLYAMIRQRSSRRLRRWITPLRAYQQSRHART